MRRIRLLLALVSAAVLGLVGALTWRALEGLAVERAVRHEAVARRAFDEMERALSRVLQREEERPFEHYTFSLPGTGERSPLAGGLEPFVVGAFQVGPDGRITTPLEPADGDAARARGEWPPAAEVLEAIARVRRTASALWSEGETDAGGRGIRGPAGAAPAQAPGTTQALSGPGVGERTAGAEEDVARAKEEPQRSLLDALEAFNRGADSRSERRQKVVTSPQPMPEPQRFAADRLAPGGPSRAAGSPSADAAAPGEVRETEGAQRRAAALRIAMDPMVGLPVDAQTLVLYRTVLVGQHGYRQGLVIDRSLLAEWLERSVIGASGLAGVAELSFALPEPDRDGRDRYIFTHRFAEPFDALSAHLVLATLPEVGRRWAIYALVAVLLAVGAAGLAAVHRTAAVAVGYAERRSNFVAAVTHELKTPLTAIRMYGEMLRDGLVPNEAKRREYFATITDESERLTRLVDNVLELSRLESGRRDLQLDAAAAGPVLEETARKLRAHAEREGFRLEVAVEAGLPAIRFDRDALLQVLFNLVDNAVKYASERGRKVVRLEAYRDGAEVVVAVRDFGPGVPGGQLERVFEPFYRAESELTRTHRGTGIGLALVKELALRMGADVSGANADGGGLRVRLAFPATEPTPPS